MDANSEFDRALDEVAGALEPLRAKGISIGPVDEAIENLRSHAKNIGELASRIDAIREEIIAPVRGELKRANLRSFGLGIVGILITLGFSILKIRQQSNEAELVRTQIKTQIAEIRTTSDTALKSIVDASKDRPAVEAPEDVAATLQQIAANVRTLVVDQIGINKDYTPVEGEVFVRQFSTTPVLNSDDAKISLELGPVTEVEIPELGLVPVVLVRVQIDGQPISDVGMPQLLELISPKKTAIVNNGYIRLAEGDSFRINDHAQVAVRRVFRKETKILARGDNKDGALFEISGK